ncbi:hypothetical protein F53441_9441 [Fusarium austroafricanum]|uniref:Uncharacterized protein n=1 Tax=Fusarium austroafricanum TaxID=2364996 RepID=A0A8H4NTB2_9HYPO|nr:hypothetical protein F53441_9441 [Fusarium austroafricanum]
MATSKGLTVPRGNDGGLQSPPGSVSNSSTYSLLNLLPSGPDLRAAFRELITQLVHERQELSPSDLTRWQNNREHLARLIWNHTARPYQMRQDTSYEARLVGERKVVFIGCKTRNARNEVKSILGDCGAIDFIRGVLHFDDIHVDMKFKGHLSKAAMPSGSTSRGQNHPKWPMLGMHADVPISEDIPGLVRDVSRYSTTLGGVILVDGKPYGLATGCPFARGEGAERDNGEVVVHSYSGFESPWTPSEARQLIRERNEQCHLSPAADWALITLHEDMIAPNTMIPVEHIDGWPWPSQEIELELFVQGVVNEKDLAPIPTREKDRLACLTFSKTSSVPFPGFIAPSTSIIMLDSTLFTVLRIDMLVPLEFGDSGSWVVVGNKVCGVIIAGSGRPYELPPDDEQLSESHVFSAYMLPMKDVLESISKTLDLDVSLPTLADYRIDYLQRHSGRWDPSTLPSRHLDMEFLLCQQKHVRRKGKTEAFDFDVKGRKTTLGLPFPQKLSWHTRYILEGSIGLRVMGISKPATPSLQQLQAFIYCIVSGFKGKDLKHLYLLFNAGSRVENAAPTSESWLKAPPPRLSSLHRLGRSLREWTSGKKDVLDLSNVDTALDLSGVSATWTHSVTTTTRILTLLQKIYVSDKKQILVYSGQDASWIASYAYVVLGLVVNCREIDTNGVRFSYLVGLAESQMQLSPRVDVVVYFGDQSMTGDMCEIVDRIDVGRGVFAHPGSISRRPENPVQ